MGLALIKLSSAVVSIALGSAILARDHGLKANRLIAAFLLCNAWWASLEFFLYQQSDSAAATVLLRWMSLGWMPLGVLCMHASLTLSSTEDHPAARLIPFLYGGLAVVMPFAVWTNLAIGGAAPTPLGWRPLLNPGMAAAYLLMAVPVVVILVNWRGAMELSRTDGQLQLARIVFFGLSGVLVAGTVTAIALPLLEIDSIGFSTSLIAAVGLATAWTLRTHGHSLISPQAFAREILDTLEDGVVLVGDGGIVRDANGAFRRMVGACESGDVSGRIDDWIPGFPVGGTANDAPVVVELRTQTGEAVPIVVSEPVACHEGGRLVGQAYLLRDRREVVSLQRQLVVSARLAAVGDLSKPISQSIHDPVARVCDQLEGLAIDWQTVAHICELAELEDACREAIDEGEELISECVEGAERVFEIVREVGSFTEESAYGLFVRHSFERIVQRAIRIASVQAPSGLVIEARLDHDIEILCHFSEIERAVTNLLVNAVHALDGKPPGEAHVVVATAAHGGRAMLHIEDDGCGIEADALDRIFDPFFTTKPIGKGTGLGLAISHRIVKAHGGEIRISSIPGCGTSASVELPCAPADSD